jgi:hypothetical protein
MINVGVDGKMQLCAQCLKEREPEEDDSKEPAA